MNKNRLEAFSDGVFAIIITIMILEIKAPHGADWDALKPLTPVFLSYIISFLFVGIYWANHHHLLHTLRSINSPILLSNLNLLFWLSLVPVATGWMGENNFAPNTIIMYGILLMLCGMAYTVLQYYILKILDPKSILVIAIKKQTPKVVASLLCDIAAIVLAHINPYVSGFLLFIQSAIWLIPSRDIEQALKNH